MPKTLQNADFSDYAPVADRLALVWDKHPTGRITTDLVSKENGEITFRARVYRTLEDRAPAATGWASERIGDGEINAVACLENTETSAIGRALANLGFTASRLRPSYEEMQKAERARLRFQSANRPATNPPAVQLQVSEPKPDIAPRSRDAASASRDRTAPTLGEKISNRTSDVLLLLKEAGEKKVPGAVLHKFREEIGNGFLTLDDLARMERHLRHWIINGYTAPPSSQRPDAGTSRDSVNTPPQ